MKTEEELRARVRELVEADLARRLAAVNVKLPHRCTHNYRDPLDRRKEVLGEPNESYNRIKDARHLPLAQTMGLCMLGVEDPEQWPGDICDDPVDAERCPYFTPKKSAEAVEAEFYENLKDAVWVTEHLPAVAALLWVHDESELPDEVTAGPGQVIDILHTELPLSKVRLVPGPVEPAPAPLALVEAPLPWWRRLWRRLFR